MNIGIISSSEGSSLKAFFKIINKHNKGINFFVISDRNCGIIDFAQKAGVPNKIISTKNNTVFSKNAKEQFKKWGGVDFIVLFFTRLIDKQLYNSYPVFNIHPSLLPAFRGFNPIKKALQQGVRFTGTTLHLIDQYADNGPIVAQGIIPIGEKTNEKKINEVSFVQRVYLMLLLLDLFENKAIYIAKGKLHVNLKNFPQNKVFNPGLKNTKYLKEIVKLDKLKNTRNFID